jgi:hypothetical protein
MKNINRLVAPAIIAVLTVGVGHASRAEDLSQRQANRSSSLASGFAGTTVPLLRKATSGLENGEVARQIYASLCGRDCKPGALAKAADRATMAGSAGALVVQDDGTSGHFQSTAVLTGLRPKGKGAKQLTADRLEALGRKLIAEQLSSVVTLGPGEALVPMNTTFQIAGGQSAGGEQMPSEPLASAVVIGRSINGIPIVGGGSTVTASFDADENLLEFQYLWPKYEVLANEKQNAVDPAGLIARVQAAVVGKNQSISPLQASAGGFAYPVALSKTASLVSLECGYFDPRLLKITTVQPGCQYHVDTQVLSQDGKKMRGGATGAVPGGNTFIADAGWPEASFLAPGTGKDPVTGK